MRWNVRVQTGWESGEATESEVRARENRAKVRLHKRPFVGVSQGSVLGFGDGFAAILRGTVAKR